MKFLIVVICTAVVIAVSICSPGFLAENAFLDRFAGEGAVGLLAVILTVTLASVANIHLSINRIVAAAYRNNLDAGKKASKPVRREINENAWLLVIVFVLALLAIFVKSIDTSNVGITSFVNGLTFVFLLTNILVLYDIYKVVFTLAESELDLGGGGASPP